MEKKKNTPKLRFPEFTGEWEEKKLGEIAEIIMGQSPIGESYNTDGVGTPLINGPAEFTEKYPVKIKWTTEAKKYCQKNDILFCVRGSTTGRMNISNDNYCIGRGVAAIREKSNNKTSFIEFILSRNINALLSLTSGSTFQNIDSKTLNDFPLFHTIIEEQTKIATFLTAVDEKLTQLKKKKTLLEQYKKGVMQKLFSQELRFKDDNNQDFPDWQEKTLGEIAIFINGRAYKQEELLEKGKYPVLRVGNLNSNNYWYYSDLELDDDKYCDNGDLLYAWSASFGPKIWNEGKMIYHYHIWKVLCTELVLLKYLYYVLDEQTMKMKTSSTNGFALLHITKETIEKWIVILPSFPEQQKIANFFSSIDEKIDHCVKQIEKMDTWKKGLLQQMFC